MKNIRREYTVYPDMIYNPGRAKVLKSFLQLPRIYKTAYFYQRHEEAARENVQKELELIS